MSNEYFKPFIYGVLFVIYCSCILCKVPYPIPEPKFEFLKPKGFRISIVEEPILSANVTFIVRGRVSNASSTGPMDAFGPITFHLTEERLLIYENNVIELTGAELIRFMIQLQDKDTGRKLNESSHEIGHIDGPVDCKWSKTLSRGVKFCQGELIFLDDFGQQNGIYSSYWDPENRIPLDDNDADFVLYSPNEDNFYRSDGNLFIRPIRVDELPGYNPNNFIREDLNISRSCTGKLDIERECKRKSEYFRIRPPIVTAMLTTRASFSFRYAKIEVRARLPKGDWLFPLITLDPLYSDYGKTGYASGQMRIAFNRGNEHLTTKEGLEIGRNFLSGGVVLKPGEEDRHKWLRSVCVHEGLGNEFHTYTLTWTDTEISVAYDGHTYGTLNEGFNYSSSAKMAPFDKPFYISLGVSAGGISDFPDGCVSNNVTKPWTNTSPKAELNFWKAMNQWGRTWHSTDRMLVVDYVKVWAV